MEAQRVVGAAAGRGPHRPGGGNQVGRFLRPGRAAGTRPGALPSRAARARGPGCPGGDHRRDRRTVAVPAHHAGHWSAGAVDHLGASHPARSERGADRHTGFGGGSHRRRPCVRPGLRQR